MTTEPHLDSAAQQPGDISQALPEEQPSVSEPAPSSAFDPQTVFDPFNDWPSTARSWWPELAQTVSGALGRQEFDLAVSLATTLLEESVRSMADAPPDLGGNKLYEYAFKAVDGVLTAGVPAGEAAGYVSLFCGISQAYRNKVHHNSRSGLAPHEALQVVGSVNLGLTVARRLAFQTYLAPFVPDTGVHYLLESREIDMNGNGQKVRFVSFASGQNPATGTVFALRKAPTGWRRIKGAAFMKNAFLSGKITSSTCTNEDRLQVFISFARPFVVGQSASFAIVPLVIEDDELRLIPATPEATWSFGWPHEVKDALGRGCSQLISHRVGESGSIVRLYFGLGPEGFEPLHQELEQR